jgi:predicted nucleic-acid-binding Zn-ribbon protein
MKASKQCPKCHSLKVGYLEQAIDRGEYSSDTWPAAVGKTEPRSWFAVGTVVGALEAYLCAECGYYETYVKDPATVPFDQLAGFHWLNETADPGKPYR